MKSLDVRKIILFIVVIIIVVTITVKLLAQNKKVEYKGEEQFYYNDRVYTELTKEEFEYLRDNKQIGKFDLGEEIFKLEYNELEVENNTTYCKELENCKVYKYNKIDSEVLLIVKEKSGYKLFGFSNFINETQEELFDSSKIIDLYNLKAENISSIDILEENDNHIQVIKNITDESLIKQFLYIIDNNSYYKIDNQFYNIIENIIKS